MLSFDSRSTLFAIVVLVVENNLTLKACDDTTKVAKSTKKPQGGRSGGDVHLRRTMDQHNRNQRAVSAGDPSHPRGIRLKKKPVRFSYSLINGIRGSGFSRFTGLLGWV